MSEIMGLLKSFDMYVLLNSLFYYALSIKIRAMFKLNINDISFNIFVT